MPEPIEYLAVVNLQEALQTISTGSGYHYTVQSAAVKLDPDQNVDALVASGTNYRPFAVIEVNADRWDYAPANRVRRLVLPVRIHWVHNATLTDDTSRLKTFFRGCADVEKAIVVDITRGQRAIDTRIITREFRGDVDGKLVWAVIDVELWLGREYGLPNG